MDRTKAIQRTIDAIIPDAVRAVHECIKAGDGKLALALLERMNALSPHRTDNTSDTSLTVAINTLITAGTTHSPVPSTHPSGHEGEGDDLNLESRGQNFKKLGPPALDAEIISSDEVIP
jgi:hypothetical protein